MFDENIYSQELIRGMMGSDIDLCPECLSGLEKWLNTEAQKELKENMRGSENVTI